MSQVELSYLAACGTCGVPGEGGTVIPFDDEHDRDVWAGVHMGATGHKVQLILHVKVNGKDRFYREVVLRDDKPAKI